MKYKINSNHLLLFTFTLSLLLINISIAQEAKITASDGANGDFFGRSVAVSGNYTIIGAPFDNNRVGAAYIYKWHGLNWGEEAKLTALDGDINNDFGVSVAIYGDYALVGARYHNGTGTLSGAAYIFKRNGTIWSQEAKLLASDLFAYEHFGVSVSLYEDYALIGCSGDNNSGFSDAGAAYIFKRTGTNWNQEAKLIPSSPGNYDKFGNSVSISGNYAIVGVMDDDDDGTGSGSAYVYRKDGITWIEEGKLTASDAAEYDRFGISVSIFGDYAIVGAWASGNSGAAYIFKREESSWTEHMKLTPSDGLSSDFFGVSVSMNNNYAIIGAHYTDLSTGAAYIFERTGTSFVEKSKLSGFDSASGDYFGYSVSLSTDYVVIGAYNDIDNDLNSGSAYIYEQIGVLPVELSDFKTSIFQDDIFLLWSTTSETNNAGFDIQRSKDGRYWETLDFVEGLGNLSVRTDYEYIDSQPLIGNNYYRLKQIDYDGSYEFSPVQHVLLASQDIPKLQIYPNPNSGHFTLTLSNPKRQKANIRLLDSTGALLWSRQFNRGEVSAFWEEDFDLPQREIYFLVSQIGSEVIAEKVMVVDER